MRAGTPVGARHDGLRKPSRAASRSRRSRPRTGRSSPSSETSPQATGPGRTGRSRCEDDEREGERQVERRLLDARAAGEAGVEVVGRQVRAAAAGEHRDEQRQAVGVHARHRPPGHADAAGRRDERLDLDQQRTGALQDRRDGDPGRLAPPVAQERPRRDRSPRAGPRRSSPGRPTSSVEPKRFLALRSRRSGPYRSPSSSSTTSTRCSSVRGPARLPSLVTWPTRTTGVPRSCAQAPSRAAASRTWPTEPAGPFQPVAGERLDRVHDQQPRVESLGGREDGVRDRWPRARGCRSRPGPAIRPRRSARRCSCSADSSPEAYSTRAGRRHAWRSDARRDLQHERRLADARLAAQQHQGARHEAAAEDPVDLGDAHGQAADAAPRRRRAADGRGDPACARRAPTSGAGGRGRTQDRLDQGVPRATSWQRPSHRAELAPQAWQT